MSLKRKMYRDRYKDGRLIVEFDTEQVRFDIRRAGEGSVVWLDATQLTRLINDLTKLGRENGLLE